VRIDGNRIKYACAALRVAADTDVISIHFLIKNTVGTFVFFQQISGFYIRTGFECFGIIFWNHLRSYNPKDKDSQQSQQTKQDKKEYF